MTWHLKDRVLEKRLLKLWPEFVTNLNKSVYSKRKGPNGEFVVYLDTLTSLSFNIEESLLRNVPEYTPKSWNDYPEVTPPTDVTMLLSFDDGYCTKAYFDGEEWIETYQVRPLLARRKEQLFRYRPWED